MQAIFKNAKLSALAMVVGENKISIDDELAGVYKTQKIEKIKQHTGLKHKYLVDESTSISDLAVYGAKILFEEYSLDKNTIDAIIVVTQTPDFFIPATACYLHARLDLKQDALAFDINQACTGYVYGLYVAFSMIQSGGCKKILLINGGTTSKIENDIPKSQVKIRGDGISVSLIELDTNENTSHFEIGTDGKGLKYLFTPHGAFRKIHQNEFDHKNWLLCKNKQIYMDGLAIFNFSTHKEPLAFNSLLEYAKCTKDELDFVFFHQANKSIVDFLINKLELDQKTTPNDIISKYANLNSASIPATICDHLNTYKNPLQKNLKVALGSFGAGLSWANAIINLDTNFWCKKTQIYKKEHSNASNF